MSGLPRARGTGAPIALAAVLAAVLAAPAPSQAQQIPLVNGVPQENLSAPTGGVLEYYIDVPADSGHLKIETSGGSGDADIYVGFEFTPTLLEFDCVGWLAGNNERCWFPIPETGRYNILVHAYAAISGMQLLASFSDDRPVVQPLTNGQQVSLAVAAGTMNYYSFVVEEGSTDLVVQMSGGPNTTGDSELYVRYNDPPVQDEFYWDCRPWIDGNNETCVFETPEPGLWYAGVEAWHLDGDALDVRLVASWNAPDTGAPSALQVVRSGARMRPVHQLSWSGGSATVEVWLNGSVVHRGPNGGSHARGVLTSQLPATWQVCNAGTTTCSEEFTNSR